MCLIVVVVNYYCNIIVFGHPKETPKDTQNLLLITMSKEAPVTFSDSRNHSRVSQSKRIAVSLHAVGICHTCES